MSPRNRHVQLLPKPPTHTLQGFGWLREAQRPQYHAPAAKLSPEKIAKHAALRKCIYFPAVQPAQLRAADRIATNPDLFRPPLRKRANEAPHDRSDARSSTPASGWEDPIAVGIMLAVLPPVGFMLLWGSRRYSRDAKLAITALMTVFMVLGTTAVCTALLVIK